MGAREVWGDKSIVASFNVQHRLVSSLWYELLFFASQLKYLPHVGGPVVEYFGHFALRTTRDRT